MTVAEACYLPLDGPDGERFRATSSSASPWNSASQHVGPAAALLVRAIERCSPRSDVQLARITVEILGPVPLGEVTTHATVTRPGRAVELLDAELTVNGRTALRAAAWRIATGDTSAVATGTAESLPPPDRGVARTDLPRGWQRGFMDTVQWRWLQGWFGDDGPGTVWSRLGVPLVDDEEPSTAQRAVAVADCGGGISSVLDLREWLFMNTELTIHLHRPPIGEWIGVHARSTIGPAGAGTVSAELFDERGHTGHSAQELIVRPR